MENVLNADISKHLASAMTGEKKTCRKITTAQWKLKNWYAQTTWFIKDNMRFFRVDNSQTINNFNVFLTGAKTVF